MEKELKITLAAARVNKGYTQEEAAKKFGISKSTLGKYERLKNSPNIELAERMAKEYGFERDNIIWIK